MDRKASVIWNGTLREGTGTLSTESGVLADTQYSFRTRFAEGVGTNPDELIAASLGGCFSMALSNELGLSGFHPQRIETIATATLEDLAAGWTLTRIQLDVRAKCSGCFSSAVYGSGARGQDQMPGRSFAQYHYQHERESKPMKSTKPASPAKRSSSGDRESSLKLSLEASELRYRRLFETAQDGILILDANTGKIIDVNPFLLDLLDYPFENMIGQRLWEIGLFKDIAANQAAFETLQRNEYIRYENLPLRSKAGKEIHVEFISNVYFVGSDKVIQCNIRDISARLVADAASHGRLAALELANKSKDDLLAVLSHELRTPLTAISCAADLLELGHDATDQLDKTEVPPQFDRSAVAMIRRNVQAMVRLISELLDLTHMAKGALRLKLERIDAHEVIRLALKNLESWQKLTKVGIYLQLEAQSHHIRADAGKLEQILSNLIGNALKFTPIGGRILIVTRNEGGELVIEVSDTGIGISAEALRRIFSPFEQGDSSIHPRFGGLGLGLSIARTLTAAHAGTLEVKSDGLGKGANFTLRFKVDDSAPQAREEEPLVAAKKAG